MCTIIQYIMCNANFSAWPLAIAVTSIQFRGERTVCRVCTNIVSLIWISVNSMCTLYTVCCCASAYNVWTSVHFPCCFVYTARILSMHCQWIAFNQCKNFVSGGPIFLSTCAELAPFILFYFNLFCKSVEYTVAIGGFNDLVKWPVYCILYIVYCIVLYIVYCIIVYCIVYCIIVSIAH